MVSDHVRTTIWNEWWDSNRLVRYYGEMLKEHKKYNRISQFIAVALAVMLPFTILLDPHLSTTWGWLVKALLAISFLLAYATDLYTRKTKINVLTQTRSSCHLLDVMWQELWFDVESEELDDSMANARCIQLMGLRTLLWTVHKHNLNEERAYD